MDDRKPWRYNGSLYQEEGTKASLFFTSGLQVNLDIIAAMWWLARTSHVLINCCTAGRCVLFYFFTSGALSVMLKLRSRIRKALFGDSQSSAEARNHQPRRSQGPGRPEELRLIGGDSRPGTLCRFSRRRSSALTPPSALTLSEVSHFGFSSSLPAVGHFEFSSPSFLSVAELIKL